MELFGLDISYLMSMLYILVGFSLGGSFSKSKSQQSSKSVTGVSKKFKDPLSELGVKAATNLTGKAVAAAGDTFKLKGTAADDVKFGSTLSKFSEKGKFGIDPGFDAAISQIGRDMFSRASGSAASRGQLNPANLSAVVGSAIGQAAPALAGFAQTSRDRETSGLIKAAGDVQGIQRSGQLTEEEIRRRRLAQGLDATGAITGLLGGSSEAQGTSSSFSVGAQGGAG